MNAEYTTDNMQRKLFFPENINVKHGFMPQQDLQ